jgi:hypothetical protein
MPILRLPNAAIYAQAIVSPGKLNPDLFAPSESRYMKAASLYLHTDVLTRLAGISHVDWKALKRRGFNAVVIDKDNCLVGFLALLLIITVILIVFNLIVCRPTPTSTRFTHRSKTDGRISRKPLDPVECWLSVTQQVQERILVGSP